MQTRQSIRKVIPIATSAALVLGMVVAPLQAKDPAADEIALDMATSNALADVGDPAAPYGKETGADDATITTMVEQALSKDPAIPGEEIDVRTESGVVYLEGEVPDESILSRAIQLASNIEGVRYVDSDGLKVKSA